MIEYQGYIFTAVFLVLVIRFLSCLCGSEYLSTIMHRVLKGSFKIWSNAENGDISFWSEREIREAPKVRVSENITIKINAEKKRC